MSILIKEGYKGFLFKKGKFIKMLDVGKYSLFGNKEIISVPINDAKISIYDVNDLSIFNVDSNFKSQTVEVISKSGEITLHFVNGIFESILNPGKYYFWNINREHSFIKLDLNNPEFNDDFPTYLFTKPFMTPYVYKVEVGAKQKGLLYFDHKFERLLEPGTYYFLKGKVIVQCELIETSIQTMDIVGQEILTSDKVSVRINCICNYKVVDYIKAKTEVDDYRTQLYNAGQLALRDYIGEKTLDEILGSKKDMSSYLLSVLKEKGKALHLEISNAACKDLILPGEVRDIMNTVLVAEKRAQANVITRREEVASTRSLLNTAKLMDENATLYKLKELEYIERICEKVGNINLNGGGDMLTQLTSVLTNKSKN